MQKRNVKCAVCKETFDIHTVQGVKFSSTRYAHLSCFPEGRLIPMPGHEYTEEEQKRFFVKTEAELEAEKNKPKTEREKFTDFVQQLYGPENCNWGIIGKQMKKYIEEYHYTYSGMQKTLTYYYEVLKHPKVPENGGIGIISYYYKQAYTYYYKIYQAEQANKNVVGLETKVEEIQIAKPTQRGGRRKKLKSLMEDEDEK